MNEWEESQPDLRVAGVMQKCIIDDQPTTNLTVCKCYKSHDERVCFHLRDGWHCDCIER